MIIGGRRAAGELANGFSIEPTVFADVNRRSELARTEVFGPVLSIIPFDGEDEAIEIANGTAYGLSGYIHTNDLRRGIASSRNSRPAKS